MSTEYRTVAVTAYSACDGYDDHMRTVQFSKERGGMEQKVY